MRDRRLAAARTAGTLVLAALVAGCGIRSTTVPVDAGPAPSRVSCAVPDGAAPTARPQAASGPATTEPARSPAPRSAPAPGGTAVLDSTAPPGSDAVLRTVYLVCHDQIAAVKRSVPVRSGTSALLAELQRNPLPAETKAGFYTAVPGALTLARPLRSDPPGSVRLSRPLDELPSFALAQIVCTLTDPDETATGHTLLLGGPTAASPVRAYTCTSDLRTRADAADTADRSAG